MPVRARGCNVRDKAEALPRPVLAESTGGVKYASDINANATALMHGAELTHPTLLRLSTSLHLRWKEVMNNFDLLIFLFPLYRLRKRGQVHPLASGVDRVSKLCARRSRNCIGANAWRFNAPR